jgi:hypothetical protein
MLRKAAPPYVRRARAGRQAGERLAGSGCQRGGDHRLVREEVRRTKGILLHPGCGEVEMDTPVVGTLLQATATWSAQLPRDIEGFGGLWNSSDCKSALFETAIHLKPRPESGIFLQLALWNWVTGAGEAGIELEDGFFRRSVM